MSKKFYGSLAFVVLLLATALRVHHVTKWSLSNDEIAEVRWSSGSLGQMISEVRRDAVHPPLDYFVQFMIARTHAPEWVHRVPPVIFGVATVAAVMVLASLWANSLAAIAAGVFMAVAPMHVRFSQEVRPYSMALFFVCASVLALELFARTGKRKWALGWFLLVFLSAATLYFAGMVAAAASMFRIFADRRAVLAKLWRRLPWLIAAWVMLYAPWLVVVARLAANRSPMPRDILSWTWWQLRLQTFATGDWRYEPVSIGSWVLWLCVFAGVVLAIRRPSLRVAAFWFVIGTALEIVILQIHPHYSTPRHLMPSWPAAFILAGAAIAALARNIPGRVAAASSVLLFCGYSMLTLSTYYRGGRSEWRAIAEFVHGRAQPGDTVVLTNSWADRNFGYYWQKLPRRDDVYLMPFHTSGNPWLGRVWFVSGQCTARAALQSVPVMGYWQMSEESRVYFSPGDKPVPFDQELCPE